MVNSVLVAQKGEASHNHAEGAVHKVVLPQEALVDHHDHRTLQD